MYIGVQIYTDIELNKEIDYLLLHVLLQTFSVVCTVLSYTDIMRGMHNVIVCRLPDAETKNQL